MAYARLVAAVVLVSLVACVQLSAAKCTHDKTPLIASISPPRGVEGDKVRIQFAHPSRLPPSSTHTYTCSWAYPDLNTSPYPEAHFFAKELPGVRLGPHAVQCTVPRDDTLLQSAIVVVGIVPKVDMDPDVCFRKHCGLNYCYSHRSIKEIIGCDFSFMSDWKECNFAGYSLAFGSYPGRFEFEVHDETAVESHGDNEVDNEAEVAWCPVPFSKRKRCDTTCEAPVCGSKDMCARRTNSCCQYTCQDAKIATRKAKKRLRRRQKKNPGKDDAGQ